MNQCPPAEQLAELLAEHLGDAERDALECHLGECPACQQALEHLSGEQQDWQRWNRLLREREQASTQPAEGACLAPKLATGDGPGIISSSGPRGAAMAEPFRCSQGHQWNASVDQTVTEAPVSILCPYCGAVAETVMAEKPPAGGPGKPPGTFDPSDMGTGIYMPGAANQQEVRLRDVLRDSAEARGRFTKLRLHARGGLGKVSLARDEDIGRTVALKEIRNRYAEDPQCRQRFINEAEITGQLEHPGIVPVYSLGRDPRDRPFYAMKFVHGRTLADAIAAYHQTPTTLAFRDLLLRFVAVCQAVGYAHSKGVIHRDLKPANVMLGEYGETLVLDWGLAKRLCGATEAAHPAPTVPLATAKFLSAAERAELPSANLTVAGTILGTPAYMSPEQAAGETSQVGPASDIYALGIILYEILTGRIPFEADTTEALLARVLDSRPELPSQLNRRVSRQLEAICLKALSRRQEDRYASATELAQDIERWLADEPVRARRDSLWMRLMRWERRHKPLVAGVSALLLTAAVLVVVFVLVHDRLIRQEQQRTEENFNDARQAVEEMLAKVGEERLANVSGMDVVRRQLLEQALVFYEKFAQRHGDRAEVWFDTARAYRRVGAIRYLLGEKDRASEAYLQAIRRFEDLAASFPAESMHRQELALAQHDLAWLIHRKTDQPRNAEGYYQAALGLQRQLTSDHADKPIYRKELARTRHDYGLLLQITDRPEDAERELREAMRLRRELVANPGGPAYRRALAQVHNDLGLLLKERDRNAEAEAAFREAIDLQQQVIEQLPQDAVHELPDCEQEMVAFRNNLGLMLTKSNPTAALEEYGRASELGEDLLKRFPTRPDYRQELARTYLNAGQLKPELTLKALHHYQRLVDENQGGPDCQSELGLTLNNLALVAYNRQDANEAKRLLNEAIRHQRSAWGANPNNPSVQQRLRDHYQGLAWVQLDLKDHAAAAAAARELVKSVPQGWDTYHRAAGYLARCAALAEEDQALANAYAQEAVELVSKAVAEGLADASKLHTDTFAPLRNRSDFQRVVKSLSR
jgi:serine/threonine-protein kinase